MQLKGTATGLRRGAWATQAIVRYELAHIRRGDALATVVQKFFRIVFFFHPLVWWANALIDELREYACDDEALECSQAPHEECGEGFLRMVFQANGLPDFAPPHWASPTTKPRSGDGS